MPINRIIFTSTVIKHDLSWNSLEFEDGIMRFDGFSILEPSFSSPTFRFFNGKIVFVISPKWLKFFLYRWREYRFKSNYLAHTSNQLCRNWNFVSLILYRSILTLNNCQFTIILLLHSIIINQKWSKNFRLGINFYKSFYIFFLKMI